MKDILDLTEKKDFDPARFAIKKPKTVYKQRRVPWDKDGTDLHTRVSRKPDYLNWIPSNTWTNMMSYIVDNTSSTSTTNAWTYLSYDPLFDYVEDIDRTSMYEPNIITANIFNTTATSTGISSNPVVNYWLSSYPQMSNVDGVNNYYGMRTGKASRMRLADARAYYSRAGRSKAWIELLSKDTFKESNYNKYNMKRDSDKLKRDLKVDIHDSVFDEYYHVGEFRKSSSSYRYDYEDTYIMLTNNIPLDEDTFENLIKDTNAHERYLYMRARKYDGKKKLKMKWFDRHDEYLREMVVSMRPRKEWRGVTEV